MTKKPILTLLGACMASFAFGEIMTITGDTTINESNISTYQNNTIRVEAPNTNIIVNLDYQGQLDLRHTTIDGTVNNPFFLSGASSGYYTIFNINDGSTLNLLSHPSEGTAGYIGTRTTLMVNNGGTLLISRGNLAMQGNNNATITVENGGTMTVADTCGVNVNILNLRSGSTFSGSMTLINTGTCQLYVSNGVKSFNSTINVAAGSNARRIYLADSNAFASSTLVFAAGQASAPVSVNYEFEFSGEAASAPVNVGQFVLNDYSNVNITLSQGAIINGVNFDGDYSGTSMDSNSIAYINLTNFANETVQFIGGDKSIVQDEVGSYFIKYNEGYRDCYLGLITDQPSAGGMTYYFDSNGFLNYGEVVPEPASFAAILGALAVSFSLIRRRRLGGK